MVTHPDCKKYGWNTKPWLSLHYVYNLFKRSKRSTAAESLAFFTLGMGSPTHSSVHPLSVVFTRTAKVNLFACAGPPSFTHLIDVTIIKIGSTSVRGTLFAENTGLFNVFSPVERHGPVFTQAYVV